MLDSASGKVIGNVPIGEGVDATAFDPEAQLAFASCRGATTIAHEDSPNKLTIVQTLETAPGARTMALDSQTHKIYLPSARMEGPASGEKRPRIVPNTFKIMVYEMQTASTH
jgi:hypothetical protein